MKDEKQMNWDIVLKEELESIKEKSLLGMGVNQCTVIFRKITLKPIPKGNSKLNKIKNQAEKANEDMENSNELDMEAMRNLQQQQMNLRVLSSLNSNEFQQMGIDLAGNTDGMANVNFDGFMVSSEQMITLGICFKTQTLSAIANICKNMFTTTLYTI